MASVPLLARIGWRNAVTAEGQIAATVAADVNAPGYQAMVAPTPTMLVVHRGPQGQLAGIAMLALAGDSGGGAVLLVPTSVIVDADTPLPQTLAGIYAGGGVSELSTALGRLFRVGFQQVVAADARDWAAVTGSAVLTVANPDELLGEDGEVAFEAGEIVLSGADIERYLRLRNPGEDERGHLFRVQLLWQAWMRSLADASLGSATTAAATAAPAESFASMVSELARAEVRVLDLPVRDADEATLARVDTAAVTVDPGLDGEGSDDEGSDDEESDGGAGEAAGGPLFVVDEQAVRTLVASLVPFPTSAQPGDRVRVRLLNGLGDQGQALNVATLLVPAGAEITVFGNADRFDHATTRVEYYDPAQQANAEVLAAVLGLASATYSQTGETAVDVSVIVGRDLAQSAPAPKITIPSRPAVGNG